MVDKVHSVAGCAREVGKSDQYVRALIHTGWLKVSRLNKMYIIPEEEVERIKSEKPVVPRAGYRRSANKKVF